MSIFNEILIKINAISNEYKKGFDDELEAAYSRFDKFEEEYFKDRSHRDKTLKDRKALTTLQSINEDEDESKNPKDTITTSKPLENGTSERSSTESNGSQRASKKRGKNEVDGIDSPKLDKRQKRNASAKASANISKQVNLNLNQKLRREVAPDKIEKVSQSYKSSKTEEDDKENFEPIIPLAKIKQEKLSVPPEPMEQDSLPLNIETVQKVKEDTIAMPPPVAPMPKPRKLLKEKSQEETTADETANGRRSTRTRKQTKNSTSATETRSTRSINNSKPSQAEEEQPVETETRAKRTRAKKKVSDPKVTADAEEAQLSQESLPASPAEKPRTKRTRRAQKTAVKEDPKPAEKPLSPKKEKISLPEVTSPILQKDKRTNKKTEKPIATEADEVDLLSPKTVNEVPAASENIDLEMTKVIATQLNATVTMSNNQMDQTMVLSSGVYNHAPVTPVDSSSKIVTNMNETIVLEKRSDDNALGKPQNVIMDATVVIEKLAIDASGPETTDDNSLLTNDSDPDFAPCTPPRRADDLSKQPTSAVKEKVQQFEELASRVTRTKTRAMAKKEQENEEDIQTPPDRVYKTVISAETLTKMNSMIFNGKPLQQSSSATKPRAAVPVARAASSASKLSAINKAREAEEGAKREKEDARRKKEAMLEAKREMHRKKREEKMAAAAAARIAAERERRLAVEAIEKGRREKQAQADQGRVDRLKEAERKKLELARKVAETEERRRAEEQARQARLADEQRRADAARRKQLDEAEAMKKEAAIMAKEIEKRKKEYFEKQKMKHNRHDDKMHTPLKTHGTPGAPVHVMEPVYMLDGFQYLNSDEDEDEPVSRPVPEWSTSKARHLQLAVQTRARPALVDRLFGVRVHSPDLREIFPSIDRARLKRTSSAVWRTPPNRLPALAE